MSYNDATDSLRGLVQSCSETLADISRSFKVRAASVHRLVKPGTAEDCSVDVALAVYRAVLREGYRSLCNAPGVEDLLDEYREQWRLLFDEVAPRLKGEDVLDECRNAVDDAHDIVKRLLQGGELPPGCAPSGAYDALVDSLSRLSAALKPRKDVRELTTKQAAQKVQRDSALAILREKGDVTPDSFKPAAIHAIKTHPQKLGYQDIDKDWRALAKWLRGHWPDEARK